MDIEVELIFIYILKKIIIIIISIFIEGNLMIYKIKCFNKEILLILNKMRKNIVLIFRSIFELEN